MSPLLDGRAVARTVVAPPSSVVKWLWGVVCLGGSGVVLVVCVCRGCCSGGTHRRRATFERCEVVVGGCLFGGFGCRSCRVCVSGVLFYCRVHVRVTCLSFYGRAAGGGGDSIGVGGVYSEEGLSSVDLATRCSLWSARYLTSKYIVCVKGSTGHTHTHTTAEQTTHTNTERASAQRRLIVCM